MSLPRPRWRAVDPWLCAVILLMALAYRTTLLEQAGYTGDTAKFQFVGHVGGTAHEPGSPTYLLGLQVFDRLVPGGTPALRASHFSAFAALLTLIVVDRILRLLDVSRPLAAAGAALLGVTPAFWSQAIVAEVYTLSLLLLSLIVWSFLRWRIERSLRLFVLGCAVTAIAFGAHLTTATVIPAIVILVIMTDRSAFVDARRIVWAAACALLGASQYLLLFIRTADPTTPYVEMAPNDLSSFLYYVAGGQFAGQWYPVSLSWFLFSRLPFVAGLMWYELGLFILPAVAGLALIRDKTAGAFLALIAAGCIAFAAGYVIPDIFVYFVPVYLVGAIGYGAAGHWLVERLASRWRSPAIIVLICLPLIWGARTWPWVDQSGSGMMERTARQALDAVAPNAILVVPDYDYAGVMWYLTIGENERRRGLSVLHLHSVRGEESAPHIYASALAAYLRTGDSLALPVERRLVPPGHGVYLFQPFMKPAPPRQTRYLARVNPLLYSSLYVPDRRAEWQRTLAAQRLRLVFVTDELQRILPIDEAPAAASDPTSPPS